MTVLNEAKSLAGFLESLMGQETLPSEIVVVDGGSTDRTVEIFRNWTPPPGCLVHVIEEPGANISEGRNTAISHASHDIILVTDAGTILDSAWAESLFAEFLHQPSPDVVSGFFRPTGKNFIERLIAFTITPHVSEIDGQKFLPSSRSVAFSRSAWAATGGYPEWLDYCEDLVFDLRLKELGFSFSFTNRAVVTWSARPTISAFMKQYFRYARGDGKAALWTRRHATRYLAYGLGVGFIVLSFAWPWALLLLGLGAVAYLQKFWIRLWRGRTDFDGSLMGALICCPVVVVAGDLAKMSGYPAGVAWRRIHKPWAATK